MGIRFKMAQPMIPGGLLHTMYEVQAGGHYDQDKGGQWVAGEPVRVPFDICFFLLILLHEGAPVPAFKNRGILPG